MCQIVRCDSARWADLIMKVVRGPPFNFQGWGGGGVFAAGKIFISTRLGGALKISHFITCLYRTVLEVNYLIHAESARNYLLKKNSNPHPPPGNRMVAPLEQLWNYKTRSSIPVNTKHLYNIYIMLNRRRRRWAEVV